MTRYRIDGASAAPGILLAAYTIVFSLFALWFYSLLQPRYAPNPGLAAYQPPPATVVDYEMAARLPAQHWQAPPLVEIESRPEESKTPGGSTKVVESEPERIIDVKEPKRPKASTPKAPTAAPERDNPLRDYAAAYPGYSGDRAF